MQELSMRELEDVEEYWLELGWVAFERVRRCWHDGFTT